MSRAINNRKGINPQTRRRILEIMDKVGYRPNAVAQSLAYRQTHTIALIIPNITIPFLNSIALVADKYLYEHKYNMLLCNTYWNPAVEKEKVLFAMEKRVDGIIVKPSSDEMDLFRSIEVPTVLISHTHKGNVSYIDIENDAAGYQAAEHFIEQGYQRIGFIGGVENAYLSNLRLEGFRRAAAEKGRCIDERHIRHGEYTIATGYRIAHELLMLPEPPDALFCCSDSMALGVLQCLIEKQIRIPDEFGIIGFNNDEIATLPQIDLTTIAQPNEKIGQLASELVIKMIEEPEQTTPQKILLYPELIKRSTTNRIR